MNARLSVIAIALLCVALQAAEERGRVADERQSSRGPADARGGARGGDFLGPVGRGELAGILASLAELNFTPDFTLTREQKARIQAVRDQYREQLDKWRGEHEADLKKLQERRAEFGPISRDDPTAREKMEEFARAQQEVLTTAPKDDDAVKQIKAILTEDQLKKLEENRSRTGDRRPGEGRRADLPGFLATLGTLALAPDFELTKEQRETISAVRNEHRIQMDKWRGDHAEQLSKVQDRQAALRGDPDARQKWPEVAKAQQELMATAPKDDDAIKQIKTTLTEDQLKRLAAEESRAEAGRRPMEGGLRGRFGAVVTALGELCLTGDFALTKEQKQKVQAIRDDYKAQLDKWREEHKAELAQLQEKLAGVRRDDPDAREKMREAQQDLMASAPKDDEFAQQIVLVLTEDQRQQFDARGERRRGPGMDEPRRPR